jgi:A/G-specific adenine glycosylase
VALTLATEAIRWYDRHARDLPWRRPGTTPWGVLVSEVMLQQTPVPRVEPVWLSWIARWPAPAALAAEPAAAAIRAWGRLGYPRRALRLHECATALVRDHAGTVPSDLGALLALPGIGAYTARAVAAFAYRQRHPVVDTNVRRLVARAVGGAPDGGPATTAADLVAVEALLPREASRAALASAAFMEIGAVICTARTPGCHSCPLARRCAWHRSDSAHGAPSGGRTRRSQGYAGTDRQVRGLLLAVLRDAHSTVDRPTLDAVWPLYDQRQRALASLLEDGLVQEVAPDRYGLPS